MNRWNAEGTEVKEGRREGGDELSKRIIGAAMKVHTALGPGLLESAYEACLCFELEKSRIKVERQKKLPIIYEELRLEEGYRIDILVEGQIVVELKAISKLEPVHEAQLLSYLRLSNCKLGLLLNFHVAHMRDGIRRVINSRH
jgi:GxxExxY protein